ncbi:MAG: threonine/serine exporter family protein [Treponema sp.]|nr:threonine/serine exporter family protein [Treponema sp.]
MEIKCEDMMEIAINAGTIVLENGGETYRTEETVTNIAKSLGAKTASAFVTPTVIQFSYTDSKDHYHSAIRRITKRGTNLKKIAQINELSRRIVKRQKQSNPRQIEAILERINKTPSYSNILVYSMAACSSFCFTFMFGGSVFEAICALIIGFGIRVFLIFFEKFNLGSFFISIFSGFLISILTEIAFVLHIIPTTEIVLIAVLMQVVPGLAIVNAIRDIIASDLVAGTARLVEAFMIASALSVGSVFGLLFFSFFGLGSNVLIIDLLTNVALNTSFSQNKILKILFAFIFSCGAAGFSSFYLNTNQFDIIWCALIGGVGWVLYNFFGTGGAGSYFIGSFTVALLAEILAYTINNPATVYLLPGLLPLVPGGGMFKTMRAFANGLMNDALTLGFSTMSAAGAIALGIALASTFAKIMNIAFKRKVKY